MYSKCAVSVKPSFRFFTFCSSYDDPSAEFTPRDRKRKNKTPKVEIEHSTDTEKQF
jgi:hypothetical protein